MCLPLLYCLYTNFLLFWLVIRVVETALVTLCNLVTRLFSTLLISFIIVNKRKQLIFWNLEHIFLVNGDGNCCSCPSVTVCSFNCCKKCSNILSHPCIPYCLVLITFPFSAIFDLLVHCTVVVFHKFPLAIGHGSRNILDFVGVIDMDAETLKMLIIRIPLGSSIRIHLTFPFLYLNFYFYFFGFFGRMCFIFFRFCFKFNYCSTDL